MIYVGTSGYSYKDWIGPVYTEGTKEAGMLEEYAKRFDAVELNFTYYGMPTRKGMQGMADKTPDGFQFFVKANKATTHEYDRGGSVPFLKALTPLQESNKLAGVLCQFPNSFKNNEHSRRYLSQIKEDFEGHTIVIEFRDRSWEADAVYRFLQQLDLGYCAVDEPTLPGLVPPIARVTSNTGYVRFHSRDAEKWYGGEGKERYNYNYSEVELKEWLPRSQEMVADPKTENLFVFFNNCHAGHAAVNALQFQEMLRELGLM
ncbi:MAG: DUF72 domain-containing protein [Planctomycetota bacterium]|nr:DUF72 domain-containing protein [Planctomycetota bacterium]